MNGSNVSQIKAVWLSVMAISRYVFGLTVRDVYNAVLFYLMLLIWWMMARERKMGDGIREGE
jgi:hypothetical protein